MRVMLAVAGVLAGAMAPAQDLEALVQKAEALGARTGVVVRDLDGPMLCVIRGGECFRPASNVKLLTAAAVLRGLGSGYEFTTRFLLRKGELVVSAGGDPNFITGTEHGPEVVFDKVSRALRALGVSAVRGIVLDQGPFTGPDRPADWPKDQLDRPYCSPTGGLVLERSTFSVRVQPGAGVAAAELIAPVCDVPLTGSIGLTSRSRDVVWGANDVTGSVKLNGRFLASGKPAVGTWSVRDPAAWFAASLRAALGKGGLAVDPAAPARDGEVYVHRSPLLPSLRRCLEDSSNFDAEQLLRALAASTCKDGSLQGGLQARLEQLRALVGNLPAELQLTDGCGLSRGNDVQPIVVVEVLRAVLRGPDAAALLAALPVGGESGTLIERFRHSPVASRVHAKTGWIRGVSALSGVIQLDGQRLRVFSILMNYDSKRDGLNKDLKSIQDRLVEAIAALPGRGGQGQ